MPTTPLRPLMPALLVALIAGCSAGAPAQPAATGTGGAASPSGAAASAFDRAFIDMMVPHHESAVAMAEVARQRAEHPEIRQLADEIIAAQRKEIDQLRAWRKQWFGSDQTPAMDAMPLVPGMDMEGHGMGGGTMTMDMTRDVEELRTADPFDRAFIDAMIEHHTSAVDAGRIALRDSSKPEIRSLAEEIIKAQEREIELLRGWRAQWYPGG
jgi:uncharacterized protein (DUF305 family)